MTEQVNVRKAYQELYAVLEANQDKEVKAILPDLLPLMQTRSGGGAATTFHRNEEGEVIAIRCYYHKLWMDPRLVEFGRRATSATGLNNMCKAGVSHWTKQQRELKAAEGALLERVASGELAPADIGAEQAKIQEHAARIEPFEGPAFETVEECIAYSAEQGLAV